MAATPAGRPAPLADGGAGRPALSHKPASRPRNAQPSSGRARPRESPLPMPDPRPVRRVRAALRTLRLEHPVLVHGLYTYLSATGLLLALTAATALRS